MTVQFSPGENVKLNINLTPLGASLSGTVTNADSGAPISGVLVEIVGLGSTTTAADGTYGIENIPPGTYTVRFSCAGYQSVEF
jgi:protocatechuate 3,4-dioxygenase beta subunit